MTFRSSGNGRASYPALERRACADCGGDLDPEQPRATFCEECERAIAVVQGGGTPAAMKAWTAALERLPREGTPFFVKVAPVLLREDGALVLTARASVRRWLLRRYPDVLAEAHGGPVEVRPLQAAAAELGALR